MSEQDTVSHTAILCVEPDTESRTLLADLLTDYELIFAPTAFEALSNLNRRAFHAYVLEFWLPDWSGPSLCREIRKLDPHAPVVFCTAAAQDRERARAMRAGATACFCKLTESKELRSRLRAFVRLAELDSVQAKPAAQSALEKELDRRLTRTQCDVETIDAATLASI